MKRFILAACALASGSIIMAAEPSAGTIGSIFDKQLGSVEGEVVSLAEAMPADKYNFAPTQGEFKGVRTFAQQVKHIAAVNYEMAALVLGQKLTIDLGNSENGPDSITSKEAIVSFLKDSFAKCHQAETMLTKENFTQMVDGGGGHMTPRGNLANVPIWHTFDHYGQMVEYARMNGIVPPASRGQ